MELLAAIAAMRVYGEDLEIRSDSGYVVQIATWTLARRETTTH